MTVHEFMTLLRRRLHAARIPFRVRPDEGRESPTIYLLNAARDSGRAEAIYVGTRAEVLSG